MRFASLFALACLVFAGGAHAEPLSVFVTIPPQKYFVEQVGGEHVWVQVMVGKGQSEEVYEPTPRQLASLAQAQVYFEIGVAFEDVWLDRFTALNPKMRIVDLTQGIAPLYFARGDVDPHVWTDPGRVKTIAGGIRDALAALDPAHAVDYADNLQRFETELDDLDREVRGILKNVAVKKFLVFHPSWGYFASAYGLEQIPIERDGKEPGAKAVAALAVRARAEGVRLVFVQRWGSTRPAETIAREIGAEVREIDHLAEDYIQNIRRVAQLVADTAG
ncbi:MAG: metal ABC transporter solute-binding protein, Zn/Mn family [Gammaproteobacteria bacterium]